MPPFHRCTRGTPLSPDSLQPNSGSAPTPAPRIEDAQLRCCIIRTAHEANGRSTPSTYLPPQRLLSRFFSRGRRLQRRPKIISLRTSHLRLHQYRTWLISSHSALRCSKLVSIHILRDKEYLLIPTLPVLAFPTAIVTQVFFKSSSPKTFKENIAFRLVRAFTSNVPARGIQSVCSRVPS